MPRGGLHERADAVDVEAVEVEALDAGLAAQVGEHVAERMRAVEVGVAVGRDHEQAERRVGPQQVAEEQERRLVGPVHVVEHEHDRRRDRHLAEQVDDALEQAVALGLGLTLEAARRAPGRGRRGRARCA